MLSGNEEETEKAHQMRTPKSKLFDLYKAACKIVCGIRELRNKGSPNVFEMPGRLDLCIDPAKQYLYSEQQL